MSPCCQPNSKICKCRVTFFLSLRTKVHAQQILCKSLLQGSVSFSYIIVGYEKKPFAWSWLVIVIHPAGRTLSLGNNDLESAMWIWPDGKDVDASAAHFPGQKSIHKGENPHSSGLYSKQWLLLQGRLAFSIAQKCSFFVSNPIKIVPNNNHKYQ